MLSGRPTCLALLRAKGYALVPRGMGPVGNIHPIRFSVVRVSVATATGAGYRAVLAPGSMHRPGYRTTLAGVALAGSVSSTHHGDLITTRNRCQYLVAGLDKVW